MRSKVSLASAAAAVNGFSVFSNADRNRRSVVIATTGGIWDRQMRQCFFDPFTEATGIEVATVAGSDAGNFSRVGQMIRSGDITIDLYQTSEVHSSSKQHCLQAEDLADFGYPFRSDQDFLPSSFAASGVLSAYGSTLIAYDRTRFPEGGPRNWLDFWNLRDFPGPRALPDIDDPWRVLAAALLADGVPAATLFPLDLDRAFRKLDEIRPHVSLWWRTGDESIDGFRDGTYAAGLIWQSRAAALRRAGAPLEWSHDQAFLVGDRWALVRGAPHKDNALRFLEFFLDCREGQAHRCELTTCTPVRRSAAEQVSAVTRAMLPLSEQNAGKLVAPDVSWINANEELLKESWGNWKSGIGAD